MTRNSRLLRINEVTRNNLIMKKKKMEESLRQLTKQKNPRIPLTRIVENLSRQPIYLSDEELMKYYSNKKRRRIC